MSAITAAGRKRIRDNQREWTSRQLSKYPMYAGLPTPQCIVLGELKLIGRDLYRYIRQRGVILPDGTVNPAVEAHRENAHEQLFSLQVFMGLNSAQASESRDLVADMARAIEAPVAEAPATGPDASPSDQSEAASADAADNSEP